MTDQSKNQDLKIRCEYAELLSIDELRPHPKNRNKHSKDQIDRLAKIIKYQGFRHPIIVSRLSGFIVAGHGRLDAAKKLKLKTVPVDYQEFESEEQEYAFLQSDNSIALWAELDLSGINADLGDLGPDFDIELLGLKNFTVDVADKEGNIDADEVPEVKQSVSVMGDIYELGPHRVMCGDSTMIDQVEKLMNGDKADLVFTDPPYGVNYDGGHAEKGVRREKLANDDSTKIYNDSIPLMFSFSKPKAALYLWFAATKSLQVLQVLQENDYEIRSWIIWNKNMAQFGAIGAQYKQKHEPCLYAFKKGEAPFWDGPTNEVSVWDVKRSSKNEFHPTQKPTELSQRAIRNSCPRGGVVLDLFGGSGATLIGCETEKRIAMLMELSPNYVDVIVNRWCKFTGITKIKRNGEDMEWVLN